MDFPATSAHLRIARPAGTEAQLTEPESGSQKLQIITGEKTI